MATGSDVKGILDLSKYQAERGEDIALGKFMKLTKEKSKLQRPTGISREVFALMTEEDILKMQEEKAN